MHTSIHVFLFMFSNEYPLCNGRACCMTAMTTLLSIYYNVCILHPGISEEGFYVGI